jgi:hypothetical protein
VPDPPSTAPSFDSTVPAKFCVASQICHTGGPAWCNDVGSAAFPCKIIGFGFKVFIRLTLLVRDPPDLSLSFGQIVDYFVSPF